MTQNKAISFLRGFPYATAVKTALSHVASSLHSNRVGLDRVNVPCVFSELRICCGDLGNMSVGGEGIPGTLKAI